MSSASSVLRFSLVLGVVGTRILAGCAFAPTDTDTSALNDAGCQTGCPEDDSGGDPQQGEDASSGGGGGKDTGSSTDANGGAIEDTGAHPTADTGTITSDPDSGDWINMTGNQTGCDNHPGTACGYNPTNNNTGYACLCYNGTQADGWGCEPVGSCVTLGPTCSTAAGALVCVDAGPHDAGPLPDSAGPDTGPTGTGADAGGWIDMSASATACDNHAGTPCGWNPTNNGAGYSCLCYEGAEADGWGCEPAGTVVTHGPSCP